ncbi:Cas10/Cmr2 second palm domain-containing protein [Microcoleus sp. B4-D4]|uniref:Cas10/Cmr2 second palm domain-containing protein n=1 Tax=Microcoleus sp. B4-D4 TaxID=2818667 RepID=UPI002FD0146A
MYLVLIETSGNQNYIFSTNRLRENVGASELTCRAGTQWVLEAVKEVGGTDLWNSHSQQFDNQQLRNNLLNQPELENTNEKVKVEVIIATSGKALLLTKNKDIAKEIIKKVTTRALKEAPGLDICGVYEKFNWDTQLLSDINKQLHKKFEGVRSRRPGQNTRFMRLPVVDDCNSSGLPASQLGQVGDRLVPLSLTSLNKRDPHLSQESFKRVETILQIGEQNPINLSFNLEKLEDKFKEIEWLAVIHADGNGLGEIILNFHDQLEKNSTIPNKNREYITKFRQFSIALDLCTEQAFRTALKNTFITEEIKEKNQKVLLPIIPLVLGGDDLTVICEGKKALQFTYEFLKAFEEETKSEEIQAGIIPQIAKKALGCPRLSACAGIAIIKPHFPFSAAYQLAEELMQSAKQIKKKLQRRDKKTPWPCSAIDFHILYDTSGVDLKLIRDKLTCDRNQNSETRLHARPYIITELESEQHELDNPESSLEWAQKHSWEKLQKRVQALNAEEDGKRLLPNTKIHDLRSGLFLGKEKADARLQLICDRYESAGLNIATELLANDLPPSLFWSETELKDNQEKTIQVTGFLDALDAVDFLKK